MTSHTEARLDLRDGAPAERRSGFTTAKALFMAIDPRESATAAKIMMSTFADLTSDFQLLRFPAEPESLWISWAI